MARVVTMKLFTNILGDCCICRLAEAEDLNWTRRVRVVHRRRRYVHTTCLIWRIWGWLSRRIRVRYRRRLVSRGVRSLWYKRARAPLQSWLINLDWWYLRLLVGNWRRRKRRALCRRYWGSWRARRDRDSPNRRSRAGTTDAWSRRGLGNCWQTRRDS